MEKLQIKLIQTKLVLAVMICGYAFFTSDEQLNDNVEAYNIHDTSKVKDNLDGLRLFNQNCASCHHPLKNGTGPALQNVNKRLTTKEIYFFLKNPEEAVQNSKYLKQLKKTYYDINHPPYPHLAEREIDIILDFINAFKPRLPIASEA